MGNRVSSDRTSRIAMATADCGSSIAPAPESATGIASAWLSVLNTQRPPSPTSTARPSSATSTTLFSVAGTTSLAGLSEINRMDLEYDMLRHIFNRPILHAIPTKQPINILDVHCGSGIWALELAAQHPNAIVFALSSTPTYPAVCRPHHCHFDLYDPVSPLPDRIPVPDQTMDILHQRMLAHTLPQRSLLSHFQELFRVARPGAVLELMETDARVYRCGPTGEQFNAWTSEWQIQLGIHPHTVDPDPAHEDRVVHALRQAGFIDIVWDVVSIPVGRWPSPENSSAETWEMERQVGAMAMENLAAAWSNILKPQVIHSWKACDADEWERMLLRWKQDVVRDHGYTAIRVYMAKKPV